MGLAPGLRWVPGASGGFGWAGWELIGMRRWVGRGLSNSHLSTYYLVLGWDGLDGWM
jgi:hypothetical protein